MYTDVLSLRAQLTESRTHKNKMATPDKSVIVKISVSHTYANREHFNVTHCVLGISS